MFVQSCKSVTKTISKMQLLFQEYPLKQEKVMRKAKKVMVLRIRSYLMILTDLPLTMLIMVVERISKRKRTTWREQMTQRYSKSMTKKT
jgi:hypothetical protein